MQKQKDHRRPRRIGALGLAVCLLIGLSACAPWEEAPVASSVPAQPADTLPADANSEEGIVLDASDGLLILRTIYNVEYVFRMTDDVDDRVSGGAEAGQYVRVWYSGHLEDTNARGVKLLRIEAAQEKQPDTLALGSIAEGFITSFGEAIIAIETASGERYRFVAAENVRALQTEPKKGMWVRVRFDGTPDAAVVSRVTASTAAADVFTLVGTLRGVDEEAGTISFLADTGAWYTFALGGAEIDAPDGLWAGMRRYVVSYRGSATPEQGTEHALLLRVQAERLAGAQTVQGVVCAVNAPRGSVDLCTADGRVLGFGLGAAAFSETGGIEVGDTVRIEYSGSISGSYSGAADVVSIEVRSRGGTGECSVLGTVRRVSNGILTLDAADGRTLKFKAPEGKEFPEALARGDTVRVAYRGWIAGEEMENATFLSVSRAYD